METEELQEVTLHLGYVPDFPLEDCFYWVVPREKPKSVYLQVTEKTAEEWPGYLTRKGRGIFECSDEELGRRAGGPYVAKHTHLRLQPSGRFFAPRPGFSSPEIREGTVLRIENLVSKRPLNPWKPTYLACLNFIKKYRGWPQVLPEGVSVAIWEVEECGQSAGGSVSGQTAEAFLAEQDPGAIRALLEDLLFNRPEDYPFASEVYARLLARGGPDGIEALARVARHPSNRKRVRVAAGLGRGGPPAVPLLLELLNDEAPEVRDEALSSLRWVEHAGSPEFFAKLRPMLEDPEIRRQVWAAHALLKGGGDEALRKFLLNTLKEEDLPLSEMGELGQTVVDLKMREAIPHLITRLKHERYEVRADAYEAISNLTGAGIPFDARAGTESRREAIRAWTKWWKAHKGAGSA